MSNKRRNRRTAKGARNTPMGRARAKTRLAANVTEEHDWYLDTPDVRLTRIFTIVLLLHAIAFGGIVAFKMVDKASANTGITISSARGDNYRDAVQTNTEVAAAAPAASAAPVEVKARPKPPAPLRRDRNNDNQYKVLAGQTLPEIAQELGVDPAALRKANSIISDNELYPGRWLNIPTGGEPESAAAAQPAAVQPAAAPAAAPARPKVYEVVPGDTPWGISRKLQCSFNELMRLNGIDKPESLQIGQKLKVPASN